MVLEYRNLVYFTLVLVATLTLTTLLQRESAPPHTMLDPKTFPRPPALQRISAHVLIKWPGAHGATIAETRNASWVLETFHPPTYYVPRADVRAELRATPRSTFCEWKGAASYWSVRDPGSGEWVADRAWSYEEPTGGFKDIRGDLCFYSAPWECYVDGEKVEPQPGDYYGGWMTKNIKRDHVKGGAGTLGW